MAIIDAKAALQAKSDEIWPQLMLAQAYSSLGKIDKARAAYDRACKLNPELSTAYIKSLTGTVRVSTPVASSANRNSFQVRIGPNTAVAASPASAFLVFVGYALKCGRSGTGPSWSLVTPNRHSNHYSSGIPACRRASKSLSR